MNITILFDLIIAHSTNIIVEDFVEEMLLWLQKSEIDYKPKFFYKNNGSKKYTKYDKFPFFRLIQNCSEELDKTKRLAKVVLELSESDAVLFWLKYYDKTNLYTMTCKEDNKELCLKQKKPKKIITIIPTA